MTFRFFLTSSKLLSSVAVTLACIFVGATVIFNGTVTASAQGILGDADCDGTVSIKDVTAIQCVLAEIPKKGDFSEPAADVDKSGVIDIFDATHIQLWLASLESLYPIGSELDGQQTETTEKPPTEKPTEPLTEPPAEPSTEKPTEPLTEPPTEPSTQSATDAEGWGRDIFQP